MKNFIMRLLAALDEEIKRAEDIPVYEALKAVQASLYQAKTDYERIEGDRIHKELSYWYNYVGGDYKGPQVGKYDEFNYASWKNGQGEIEALTKMVLERDNEIVDLKGKLQVANNRLTEVRDYLYRISSSAEGALSYAGNVK